jgi:hypothetical protein
MKGEYDMSELDLVIEGGIKAAPAVIPGDPDGSPLVQYCRGVLQPRMPREEENLPPEALHTIRMWIAAMPAE